MKWELTPGNRLAGRKSLISMMWLCAPLQSCWTSCTKPTSRCFQLPPYLHRSTYSYQTLRLLLAYRVHMLPFTLQMNGIGLIVFDECHHTKKKDPYNRIMQEHYFDPALSVDILHSSSIACNATSRTLHDSWLRDWGPVIAITGVPAASHLWHDCLAPGHQGCAESWACGAFLQGTGGESKRKGRLLISALLNIPYKSLCSFQAHAERVVECRSSLYAIRRT